MMKTAVWWIRRDLRLTDNQALHMAMSQAQTVVPLFIIDPFFVTSPFAGEKRTSFLWAGLRELDSALKACGSRLVVRRGQPEAELAKLLAETGAEAIFAEADYSSYARKRDSAIQKSLPLHLEQGIVVHHPDSLLKDDGTPYQVFTPFKKRAWLTRPLPQLTHILPPPEQIRTPENLTSLPLPDVESLENMPFIPGEAEAHKRLQTFMSGDEGSIFEYAQQRNQLDLDGTSKLSPYLRFGMISARQVAATAVKARSAAQSEAARNSADTFLSEIIWREFYYAILYHFPHVAHGSFRPQYDQIQWRNDPVEFAAWCKGETGYPVVDAAMRQLLQTGWMHNRARMIVASFLVKDLLIDWRWGERFFMLHLLDGDPANNNGGWQWTAGTGTDAAPYFRIFNPVTQSKRFDPKGRYIRRWLPELAPLSDKHIHSPWEMPRTEQKRLQFKLGQEYPEPIVEHKVARERALAAYKQAGE